jgi:uncharacterized coiled-coil protein SlyX
MDDITTRERDIAIAAAQGALKTSVEVGRRVAHLTAIIAEQDRAIQTLRTRIREQEQSIATQRVRITFLEQGQPSAESLGGQQNRKKRRR